MKGIILAGGSGTRLRPLTQIVSKQLLPIYDKPMVYYPLTTLMLAGISELMVISTPEARAQFEALLGDGAAWGLDLCYAEQPNPEGIAQALVIARDFIDDAGVALALGDNLFFGQGLSQLLRNAAARTDRATVFAYRVNQPQRYGVIELDGAGAPVAIVEKPAAPRSPWAVTGLYFFDGEAANVAGTIKPSARGELEIVDVIDHYLKRDALHVEQLGRGFAWMDAGTPDSLYLASDFVRAIEHRQALKIGCPEEVAFRMGFIDDQQLRTLGAAHGNTEYGAYLSSIADEPC